MSSTVEIRLSQEELAILRESVKNRAENLTRELEESMERDSTSEIVHVARELQAAQSAKYKLYEVNVEA